ncbi:MAG: ComEC/Rec2 family competence protein, partial [Oscillibacter sp.]|nr:ComEC/Rec2 family competence protein [Oscillibacter sp.]
MARYAFPDGAPLSLALAFFCAAALALLLPQGLWRRRLFLCCVALSLALGWDYLFLRQVARPAEALAGTRLEARMTLLTDPEKTAFGARATVRADGVAGKLVYYGGEDLLTLQAGDRLTGEVLLKSARTVRDENLTTFSSRGIFLLAYGRGEMRAERGERTALRYLPQRAARALRERVRLLFDDDVSGLLIGVLTGRKGELSAQAETDLSECGLYHILAVSGMHCGFLLLFVTLFTGRHRRVLRSLLAVPLLLFYALLTGASPSTVRACVMLVFLLAAPLASRQSDPLTALSFALMALLVQNPFAAQSVSLQLSFAAMAGLLCVTSRLYRALTDGERCGALRRALALSVSASVGALVFTAPITAYYFGIFVTVGVLSNLLCLPAAGALFLAGVAAVLLSFVFLPLGRLLALVATVFARYLLGAAHLLAKLPYFFKVPGKWPSGGKGAKDGCGVWDAQGRDHFGVDVTSVHAAWYARPVEIPASWKGRRILLSFNAIPSAVLVFVDGRKAGEAFFPGGEVDLTAHLTPGKHEIALFTSAKLPETLITAFDAPDTARTFTKKSIENRGIFGDVALAAEPIGMRISDVQVRPSVGHTSECFGSLDKSRIDFSVGLTGGLDANILSATAVVKKSGQVVKRFAANAVKPGEDGRIVFGGEWEDPELWDLDAPQNLYTVEVSLSTGGGILDELYPETFGFRDIRVEGRNLLLNGTPIHLQPRNSVYAVEGAVSYADCREAMRRHRAFGFNAIVFHKHIYGYSEGDTAMLDMAVRAASDEGLACIVCLPHPNRFDDPKNPHHWTYGPAYERIVRHLVRRVQNVPGVILWSSTHNQTGYESDQNPALITGRPEDVPTGIVNWRQRFRSLAL